MAIITKTATHMQFVPPATDTNGNPLAPATLSYKLYKDGLIDKLFGVGVATPVGATGMYEIFIGDRVTAPGTYSLTLSAVSEDGEEGAQSAPLVVIVTSENQIPNAPSGVVGVVK
jgi:hypothetical protein